VISRRRIEREMRSLVWSAEPTVNKLNDQVWGLKLSDSKLLISSMYFSSKGIGVLGEIGGNWELKNSRSFVVRK